MIMEATWRDYLFKCQGHELFLYNLLGMEGLKRKRRCETQCKEHLFSLVAVRGHSNKYDQKILFCPKYQRQPFPPEHTFPQFNPDNKYYTSAFVLGVDKRPLQKNDQQELMDHQKQIRDSLEKNNQLVFPRPTSKHTQCSVCKEPFKNYYIHIASQEHRDRIMLSPYNSHIQKLCNIYKDLWEGAEERADELAEREGQSPSPVVEVDPQDESDSLADVQKGQPGPRGEKMSRKNSARPVNNHEDTMPLGQRPIKRTASKSTDGKRQNYEGYRKRGSGGNYINNPVRQQRERQERRYERERDKIKTDRDAAENTKEFVKMREKEGDVFLIMRAAFKDKKPNPGEFVWKKTRNIYLAEKDPQIERYREQEQPRATVRRQTHIDLTDEDKPVFREHSVERTDKSGSFGREGTNYYPPPQYPPPQEGYKGGQHDRYKGAPPCSSYSSYPYSRDYPYRQGQKGYGYPPPPAGTERENGTANSDEGYDYNMYSYPWHYQQSYYGPPVSHEGGSKGRSERREGVEVSSGKEEGYSRGGNNTNININFPAVCIYPPHPHYSMPPPPSHSRYPHMAPPSVVPHHSYMDYQYPPYASSEYRQGHGRQGAARQPQNAQGSESRSPVRPPAPPINHSPPRQYPPYASGYAPPTS